MTPSNPDNNKPLIYRICDAGGVFHLVAPFDHTHSQDEVEGLPAALNNKAEKNHSHDFIGEDTEESAAEVTASEGRVHIEVREVSEGGGECDITPSNIGNLARALETPDATPTANSDKLVTSGGVKTALDGKMDNDTVIIPTGAIAKPIPQYVTVDGGTGPFDIDTLFDVGAATDLGMARVLLVNDIGQDEVANLIESREYGLPIHANSHGIAQINQGESVLLTVYKMDKATVSHEHDWCYYVTIDGIFDELTPQQ